MTSTKSDSRYAIGTQHFISAAVVVLKRSGPRCRFQLFAYILKEIATRLYRAQCDFGSPPQVPDVYATHPQVPIARNGT